MTPAERTKANARRKFFTEKMERDLNEIREKMSHGWHLRYIVDVAHEEALRLNHAAA